MTDKIKAMENVIPKKWLSLALQNMKIDDLYRTGKLVNMKRRFNTVYPKNEDVFNSLRYFDPENTSVVILGQDPYINKGEANGLSFSTGNDTIPPSLRNIFLEIESDVYNGLYLNKDPDLSRWAEQGVLLLNTILTVDKGKSKSHSKIGWDIFTKSIIKGLSELNNEIIFLLWGGDAHKYEKYITNKSNIILKTGHPSPLSANRGYWFGNKHFSKTNNLLKSNNKQEIIW